MRVCADPDICQGHGRCHAVAPAVFPLDDAGYVALAGGVQVPAGEDDAAREGVAACPERALTIVDG